MQHIDEGKMFDQKEINTNAVIEKLKQPFIKFRHENNVQSPINIIVFNKYSIMVNNCLQ